jgi:uncharacterized coiled-coil protein SlyX
VNESSQAKLDRLEVLYTEQEYTIQTLNDMLVQQNREISSMQADLAEFRSRLQAMKSELPDHSGSEFEKPPHY